MNKNLTTTIIVAVIAIAIGFFAGTKYQASKATSAAATLRAQFAAGGTGRGTGGGRLGAGGGQVTGTILSADSGSITVKLQDGSSKIVIISGSTAIDKTAVGSMNDLSVGTRVGVFGTTNSDGSVTAQNVQVNPAMRTATPSAAPTK